MSGFFTAPQVAWGPGAVEQLSGLGAHRALLVVDPVLARRQAHRRIEEEFAKADCVVEVVTEVAIEPTFASTDPGLEAARRHRPDWIVALGGGSTLDTAKGIWIRYARPDLDLSAVTPLVELGLRSAARFVAIPTTAGSGSEASWVAHLRAEDGRLGIVGTRESMPDWALLDPSFLESLPPALRAETGADAIAHALESIWSAWANPLSNALAREALAQALAAFPRGARGWDETDPREGMLWASTLAGLAVANSELGLAHALAHALGGSVRLGHARLVAALLPYVAEFNYPAARERFLALGPVLGPSVVQNRSGVAEKLRSLWAAAGLPRTLEDAGVDRASVDRDHATIVARALRSPPAVANPRVPSEEEVGRLLDAAFTGASVGF